MKTLTTLIALFALSTAAMAESNYTPRQTQVAFSEAQAQSDSHATAPADQQADPSPMRNTDHYTRH